MSPARRGFLSEVFCPFPGTWDLEKDGPGVLRLLLLLSRPFAFPGLEKATAQKAVPLHTDALDRRS